MVSTGTEMEENEQESVEEEAEDGETAGVEEAPIEEDGGVQEVPIEGDGDCFYSAIVEAFNRQGIDITSLLEAEVKIFNRIWHCIETSDFWMTR